MLPCRQVRGRSRGHARALAVALLTSLLGGLLPLATAATARAEQRTVSGGRLDWAIKSSFQAYVTGPIAQGSWGLSGGAATVGANRFRFHSATGGYDPATGTLTAGFSGAVRFTGHKKPDGGFELDLTISRPQVTVSGGRGTLYADMTSKEKGTGRVTTAARVPLASLDLGGVDTRGGGSPIALDNVPATLTAQGARAFAGYYPAGTALDPVSLSADVKAPGTEGPAKDGSNDDRGTTDGSSQGEDRRRGGAPGNFADAAVDWGVRRTFREYVTGDIAKGAWRLTDGAQDGGAVFRFPKGKGSYDPEHGTLEAEFTGTVRFTGTHLDLALSRFAVKVTDGRGTLSARVTGVGAAAGATADRTPLVTFDAKGLKPADGLAALTEAPAKLTEEGARAFGGMYRAGTEMDPVSLAVAVEAKAALPALPDLGSDPAPPTGPASATKPRNTAASADATAFPVLPVSLGVGALALVAAAFLVLRARRRTPAPTAQD
ncbi:HtaA domain-containing protein [Streptomyces yunnanensis]|uniref:Htaa protein n=1 Tax=Streptomyces yunnanensis TaxID=156453 RepID=A0A9X8N2A4_9ACTN|nr:HtaA domain-containing protein [Streptomyces yunnanensis]SHM71641.1 Htaa protein [Streptomyces yunnanensis]